MQGVWAGSLVGKLRSHMYCMAQPKNKYNSLKKKKKKRLAVNLEALRARGKHHGQHSLERSSPGSTITSTVTWGRP